MDNHVNMICRMCLQCNDLVGIFNDSLLKSDFHEKIQKYLNQNIKREDDMPKFICLNCINRVLDFDSYCVQVAENQLFLRNNFKLKADVPTAKKKSDGVNKIDIRLHQVKSDKDSKEEVVQKSSLYKSTEYKQDSPNVPEIKLEEYNDFTEIEIEIESSNQNEISHDDNIQTNNLFPNIEADFPKTIMKDGRYIIRGRSLGELVSRFYTLKCDLCAKDNLGGEKLYSNISQLFTHFKKKHSTSGYVTCCGLKLSTRKVLTLHMVRHVQPEAFKCSICGKKTSSPSLLQGHMRCHSAKNSSSNEIRCDECGIKFNSPHSLEIHKIKVHTVSPTIEPDENIIEPHKDFPGFPSTIMKNGSLIVRGKELDELLAKFYQFSCDLCQEKEIYSVLPSLFNHYKQVHSVEGYICCCGVQHKTRRYLVNHMARHLDPEAFTCPQCGKMTTRPGLLRTHLETHKPKDEKLYYCPKCPKRYSGSCGLEKHLISHIPKEERQKFVCNECAKVYFTLGALQDHVRYYHCEPKLICDQCGEKFKNKTALKQHSSAHSGESCYIKSGRKKRTRRFYSRQLPFDNDCSICGERFQLKSAMQEHMSEKHDTVIHKCKHCDYTSQRWELLSRHIAKWHMDKKLFCDVCGKHFPYKHLLVDHEQVHTGIRRYTCEFCGKKYASVSGFSRHRRDVHTLEYAESKRKRREIRRNKKKISDGTRSDEV